LFNISMTDLPQNQLPPPLVEDDLETPQYLSARATQPNGQPLTPEEIEAAEAEAEAWARRVNSC